MSLFMSKLYKKIKNWNWFLKWWTIGNHMGTYYERHNFIHSMKKLETRKKKKEQGCNGIRSYFLDWCWGH
jgi:hypothetical protein